MSKPLKVIYTGALKDFSGYAEAARGYVRSLDSIGVDVTADVKVFEPNNPPHLVDDVVGRRLYDLISKPNEADIHIIHTTPDIFMDYASSTRPRIGYFAWETNRLPNKWVRSINQSGVSEVWVPCEYLRKVCESSGVNCPAYSVPHVIETPSPDWEPNCSIVNLPDDKLKFYSIFQWSERKNAEQLLRAYYEEFSRNDSVVLVLKTYRVGNGLRERDYIRRTISTIRKNIKGTVAPPVILIEDFLSKSEMMAMHYYCDCYVTMARNEGFGIPAFEAAAFGNPVIVPNYSAFPEHFTEESSYLIDVPREVNVANMNHISILYRPDMMWGDPSVESCKKNMREVLENWNAAKAKGQAAKMYISENLSQEKIGKFMKGRLECVYRETTGS